MHVNVLPDCPLSALRRGLFPDRLRHAFARAAAEACARYVLAGGELSDIREDLSRIQGGRLFLKPEPLSSPVWPRRDRLENDLQSLAPHWGFVFNDLRRHLCFLLLFARHLSRHDPAYRFWARMYVLRLQREKCFQLQRLYQHALNELPSDDPSGIRGLWKRDATCPLAPLLSEIQALENAAPLVHESPRASVYFGRLRGEEVVIKHFAPNPSRCRRAIEISRARRAWAGSLVLEAAGLQGPEALGWIERQEKRVVTEAWFISRGLPPTQTAREWLRFQSINGSREERVLFRHRLRTEIRRLHAAGLYHRDVKLNNLLLSAPDSFWWIDLEDIRAGGAPFWTLVRTYYQLNGSVPRRLPRDERLAFAAGFRRHFPLADHPLVLHYVEHKTRVRLRREVKRICGT